MPISNTFTTPQFLLEHIDKTMAFYHPKCIDKQGGFYQYFLDNGDIYNDQDKHLVSSCRFVFNYAMAVIEQDRTDLLSIVKHGLDYINDKHKNPFNGGYAWQLNNNMCSDDTNHCYGLAFVLLTNAVALKAGVLSASEGIEETWQLLEKHFWDDKYQLYKEEYDGSFTQTSDYRGQNSNMHMCEAMLMAYEATHTDKYLRRAYTLASNICIRQAEQAKGLIWEHYNQDWQIDWDYNLNDPKHLFRPWGYQPGHFTEWSKLLLILYRHQPENWMIERAEFLFNTAVENAWDSIDGGIYYSLSPEGGVCDDDKYFWVQAESFAAAALLALATNNDKYWDWYNKIWDYAWTHMVDHKHGAWYRILKKDNSKYDNEKSPAGKTDYHTMGACYEVLRGRRLAETSS